MTYSRLITIFLITQSVFSCSNAQESTPALSGEPVKTIQKIAGYDVSSYGLVEGDLYLPYQKMTKNHLICLATEECDLALLEKLLKDGADPNFDCDTDAAITNLAFCEDRTFALTKLMIQYGADINATDGENDSFLNYVTGEDDTKTVELLLSKGAVVDTRDTNPLRSCTTIHGVRSVEMLNLLLKYEVDPSSQCLNGRTLLHYAARENNSELIAYILKLGLINPAIVDNDNETALDYAKRAKASETINLLVN